MIWFSATKMNFHFAIDSPLSSWLFFCWQLCFENLSFGEKISNQNKAQWDHINSKVEGKLKKVQVSLVPRTSRDRQLFRSELSGVRVTGNQKKGEKGVCWFFYLYNINLTQIWYEKEVKRIWNTKFLQKITTWRKCFGLPCIVSIWHVLTDVVRRGSSYQE